MSRTRATFSYHNKIKVVITQLDNKVASSVARDSVTSELTDQAKVVVAAIEKAAASLQFPVISAEAIVDYVSAATAVGNFMPVAWLYDEAQAVDVALLNLFKNVTEDALVAETATFAVIKALVDQGTITDFAQLSFARPVVDSFSASDLMRRETAKRFFETATASESSVFVTAKALFDALNVTDDVDGEASILDDQEIQFFKNVTQVASASDSLSLQMDFVRFFTETPVVSELLAKQLSRSLSDAAAPVDTLALGYGASKLENTFLSDTFSRVVSFSRVFSDQPVLADALSKSLERSLTDSFAALDALTRVVVKQLTDPTVAQDTLTKGTGKTTADAVGADEILLRQFGAARTDTAVPTDLYASSLARFLTDAVAFSDTVVPSVQFQRAFQDASNATDDVDGLASILDDQEILFEKTNNNTLFVAESDVLSTGKVLGDAASFADAGSLRSQGFADFTYFAEDYVGASRTF